MASRLVWDQECRKTECGFESHLPDRNVRKWYAASFGAKKSGVRISPFRRYCESKDYRLSLDKQVRILSRLETAVTPVEGKCIKSGKLLPLRCHNIFTVNAGIVSVWLERYSDKVEVVGSNPTIRTQMGRRISVILQYKWYIKTRGSNP